jgi:hypothetical protein
LWREYNDAISKLVEAGKIGEDDMRFLRYSDDAEELLMGLTRGNPDAFTVGTISELLRTYKEQAVHDEQLKREGVESELARERAATKGASALAELEREKRLGVRLRINEVCARVGFYLASTLFLVAGIVVLFGCLTGPVGPLSLGLPASLQLVSVVAAVGASTWTVLFGGSLIEARNSLQVWIGDGIERGVIQMLRID